jgi:hypothetical protein
MNLIDEVLAEGEESLPATPCETVTQALDRAATAACPPSNDDADTYIRGWKLKHG